MTATAARVGLVIALASGCVSPSAYRELPLRRQPDGVAVDPISRFDEDAQTATPADGLAILKSPPDDRVAVKTVLDFLTAMTHEDTEGIRREFTSDCQQIDPERGARDNAINAWARRFSRFDYTSLDVSQLFDEDAVVAGVVGPGEDVGCVVGEAEDFEPLGVGVGERRAFAEIFAQVRGVGAGAAVADDVDESARVVALIDGAGEILHCSVIKLTHLSFDELDVRLRMQRGTEHRYPPRHLLVSEGETTQVQVVKLAGLADPRCYKMKIDQHRQPDQEK